MAKFRSKPAVEIDAMLFDGTLEGACAITDWIRTEAGEPQAWAYLGGGEYKIDVRTPNGVVAAVKGDYVIKGTQGEFYPCKPDVFEMKYEAVS